ncbi:hypothetical protein [Photorhabdus viridis]|uniref:hypothetical protein n=1 Tax=Photorhabdus viridis TaxID=3163327 RepID=UPI0033074124
MSNSVLILDKSKESASALTKALNESSNVLSKTGKFEEKTVVQIIQAEMKSNVLSKSTLDALQTVQKIHKEPQLCLRTEISEARRFRPSLIAWNVNVPLLCVSCIDSSIFMPITYQ